MAIGEICSREVVIAERSASIADIAELMRRYHVGDIVIVDTAAGGGCPVGIVTDRDIVLEVVAPGLSADTLTAGDLIGDEVCVVKESEGIFETLRYMRGRGVRRMPVVDAEGRLLGIVTVDDLMELLADEMSEMARLVAVERRHERERRQ